MIPKKIILLISFFLIVFKGLSQNPKIVDTLKIHEQIRTFGLDEASLLFKSDFFSSIVFKNDSTLYYNPNGTLHLFKIQLGEDPKVSKISNSIYKGHNFNRLLFIHDEIVYSYGGVGLFNSFPGLIYFDFGLKGWLEVDLKNYPQNANRIFNSWKIGNKLMVLLSHYSESEKYNNNDLDKFTFGEINLENFQFTKKYEFEAPLIKVSGDEGLGFYRGNYIYDSDSYTLHGYYKPNGACEYRLFDKTLGILYRTSQTDALERVNGFSYLYIKESSIYFRDQYGTLNSFEINSGKTIRKDDFIKQYQSRVIKSNPYIYMLLPISLGMVFLFFRYRKRKYKVSNSSSQELQEIEKKLIKLKASTISKNNLDTVLSISHYSYETIKTRRSSLINELNEKGNVKIERVRKQDDKRFYDYKIS
ncbi:MAG: hypothetical protein HON09_00210 [Flavobacteriaceae bacterium]|jgi:TRAP-type mannitol/chloroaromatic compound transport system permease small subunit|nr:hypothetical protein [Flavobacteriaceae bacterium]